MDAIASSARVSKPTLYARFPDKESLLRAVVEGRAATWDEKVLQQDAIPGGTLEQRLRHCLVTSMMWVIQDEFRAFDRVLAAEPLHVTTTLYKGWYEHMIDVLTKEIEQLTASEANRVRNPRQIAFDLMVLLTGWFRAESILGQVSKRKAIAYANHAVDLVMAARTAW